MPHVFRLTRWGIAWFALSSALAMLLYPGGTYLNKATPRYLFLSNFLSDLGTIVAWGGEPNGRAAVLFIFAELVLVAALVTFFTALYKLYSTGSGRRWAQAANVAGLVAIVGIVGAALLPADRFLTLHIRGALLAFRSLVAAAAFFAIATARDRRFSRHALTGWIVLTIASAAYVAVLEWGPRIRDDYGLTFQATAQKIVVFVLLVVLWIESVAAEGVARWVMAERSRDPRSRDRATLVVSLSLLVMFCSGNCLLTSYGPH